MQPHPLVGEQNGDYSRRAPFFLAPTRIAATCADYRNAPRDVHMNSLKHFRCDARERGVAM